MSEGRETVEEISDITGLLNVKIASYKKSAAFYRLKIFYPDSNVMVTSTSTNKAIELLGGVYDVILEVTPPQSRKGVKIENGKETILDMGITLGAINVKCVDENSKEARCVVSIKNAENNKSVTSTTTNRLIEVMPGKYNVEILSSPIQSKKDVVVKAGEETVIETTVKASAALKQPVGGKK